MFDREEPPKDEVSGRGFIPGLVELWARFLGETVQGGGSRGFSHFALYLPKQRIVINGDRTREERVRNWAFGPTTTPTWTMPGVIDRADLTVLDAIARAHARVI